MTENRKDFTLLVVDDEPEIRALIADFLEDGEGYTVLTAEDGLQALEEILPNNHVDLVLSDINMPKMKGFDLLKEVRRRWPQIKRVLITAYNVEDYIELAQEHDVGNIFVKTTPFNFDELSTMLENLLTENIFGARKYFDGDVQERSYLVRKGDAIDENVRKVTDELPMDSNRSKLNLVLVELLTNAIFYGIRHEDPANKESWNYDFELAEEDAIRIDSYWNNEKYAIGITDNGGHLKKNDVLYWLNRQISRDESGMPLGIADSHGRGLFIARRYIDRLLINIKAREKTEMIIINYVEQIYQGSKPLYINEI